MSSIAPTSALKAKVDAALAAYRGLWAAFITATRHPDPNDAGIRAYARGDALNVFVSGLASMKRQGLAGKGAVELHPKTVEIEPASAPTVVGISDCVNSARSQLYKVDGSIYHDAPQCGAAAKRCRRCDDCPQTSGEVSTDSPWLSLTFDIQGESSGR